MWGGPFPHFIAKKSALFCSQRRTQSSERVQGMARGTQLGGQSGHLIAGLATPLHPGLLSRLVNVGLLPSDCSRSEA